MASKARAFCFDTETTALISNVARKESKQPRIIELYGCVVEDGNVVDDLDFLCDPGIQLSDEVQKITNISPEDLKGKLPFKDHADDVLAIIETCDTIVAHNLFYDLHVLSVELQRLGKSLVCPARRVCTVEDTEHLKGYRLSLSALHEELFGEKFEGAHRAKTDVMAMVRCYNELVKRGEI